MLGVQPVIASAKVGNREVGYVSASIPYQLDNESERERRDRHEKTIETLKANGWKKWVIRAYYVDDPDSLADAKRRTEKEMAKWYSLCGIRLEINQSSNVAF